MPDSPSEPPDVLRFIVDVHLGKLASHLRMLGFDTSYRTTMSDDEIVRIVQSEGRVLLSKDRELIGRLGQDRASFVRNIQPRLQLLEIMQRFDLLKMIAPFTRCITCNTPLINVDPQIIWSRIPDKVREWCDEYQICESCDQIYWKGSHFSRMQSFVDGIVKELT